MRIVLLLFLLLATALPALAQAPAEDAQALDGIDRSIGDVERMLDRPWIWRSQLPELRSRLEGLEGKAKVLLEAATRNADQQKGLLAALGPAPGEGQGESPEIAKTRQEISTLINAYESSQKHAKLVLAKSQSLKGRIAEIAARLRTGELTTRGTPIIDHTLWGTALGEIRLVAEALVAEWAAPADREGTFAARFSPAIIEFLVLATLVIYAATKALQTVRHVPRPTGTGLGAVAALLLRDLPRSLVPVAAVAAAVLSLSYYGALGDPECQLLTRACLVAGLAVAGMAMMARLPELVRTADVSPGEPVRSLVFLVLFFGLFVFLDTTGREFVYWPNLFVVGKFLAGLAQVVLTLRLWRWALHRPGSDSASRPHRHKVAFGWLAARLVLTATAIAVTLHPVLFGIGYQALGDWLLFGSLGTVALAAAVGYVFVLIGDGVPLFVRRIARPLLLFWFSRPLRRANTQILELALQTTLGAVLVVVAVAAVSLVWALDPVQLLNWSEGLLSGIDIGSYHFSVVDAATAVAVFVAIIVLTRVVQSGLEDRVFRRVSLDPGAKSALKSGFGYFGLGIAVLAGLLALGIDLGKLALVAGALSVGIGFGLQTIVNNFLSGLLMLAERPIKVGDWVVINGHEGVVKRISVRATEIQTFQMASVLIPNSEIISGAVTNWTFKDPTRRIELRFGVDYGADLDLVRRILLQSAAAHPRVLRNPAPQALFTDCGSSALVFDLWAFIRIGEANSAVVASDLRTAIFRAFMAAGIEIPYPQQEVRIRRQPDHREQPVIAAVSR